MKLNSEYLHGGLSRMMGAICPGFTAMPEPLSTADLENGLTIDDLPFPGCLLCDNINPVDGQCYNVEEK